MFSANDGPKNASFGRKTDQPPEFNQDPVLGALQEDTGKNQWPPLSFSAESIHCNGSWCECDLHWVAKNRRIGIVGELISVDRIIFGPWSITPKSFFCNSFS